MNPPASVISQKKNFIVAGDGTVVPKCPKKPVVLGIDRIDNSEDTVRTEEEMPEYQEKKHLMQSLDECDKRIRTYEQCLLNLHDGKVRKKKVFLGCCCRGIGAAAAAAATAAAATAAAQLLLDRPCCTSIFY